MDIIMDNLKPRITMSRYLTMALISAVLLFPSCTISLAPKFDRGIVDHLSASSSDVFDMIADVSAGTDSASFSKRQEKYNRIIGKMEALELEINTRPMPGNKKIKSLINKANESFKQRGLSALITAGDTAPSATALAQVINNLVQMKNTDKARGLTPATVQLHKGFIRLYLDQALTYERFLNR
jgi:hypothetical protein